MFATLVWGSIGATLAPPDARAGDPLAGAALYEDVRRFDAFGIHRYGSDGAERAADWITAELRAAGLEVATQEFSTPRQYELKGGTLTVSGKQISVIPHWWMPMGNPSFELTAPVVGDGDASGKFVRVSLPFDGRAYLDAAHVAVLAKAFARHPAAVLLTIEHPSGEIFTYNVDQKQAPWPVPVILVPPKASAALDGVQRSGDRVLVRIEGAYRANVVGRNVIGRLNRGAARTVVISTPVTSWFTSTCERAPGIAMFLALARIAHERFTTDNLVFIATSGHEIGHGGMEVFLHDGAPKPEETAAWVHLGASLACYGAQRAGDAIAIEAGLDPRARVLNRSQSMDPVVKSAFSDIAAMDRVGEAAAVGELREIYAAGYANFFGMAGMHALFHTPEDSAKLTGPEILEPVARAFAGAIARVQALPAH